MEAYPAIFPNSISPGLTIDKEKLHPLGGISGKTTIRDKESGEWVCYVSDEHGFNNPAGQYNAGAVDIALIGDSWAHGSGVAPAEDFAGQLRKAGYRVLNLGYGGNGPLIELATLKEYAEPMKPETVLWIYNAGDLEELSEEMVVSTLTAYWQEHYSQRLFSRQPQIDASLIHHFGQKASKKDRQRERVTFLKDRFVSRILKLRNLRVCIRQN